MVNSPALCEECILHSYTRLSTLPSLQVLRILLTYGPKQAPRAALLHIYLVWDSLRPSQTHLFAYRHGTDIIYLLLYDDDNILIASSSDILWLTILQQFSKKDLGELHNFLRMHIQRCGLKLSLSGSMCLTY